MKGKDEAAPTGINPRQMGFWQPVGISFFLPLRHFPLLLFLRIAMKKKIFLFQKKKNSSSQGKKARGYDRNNVCYYLRATGFICRLHPHGDDDDNGRFSSDVASGRLNTTLRLWPGISYSFFLLPSRPTRMLLLPSLLLLLALVADQRHIYSEIVPVSADLNLSYLSIQVKQSRCVGINTGAITSTGPR